MTDRYLLGIDNGGTVAKAALFSLDGRECAVSSQKTQLLSPFPGWAEYDPERLWRSSAGAVRQVMTNSGVSAASIVAVACTGHGNGIYLVDDQGQPVRNAIFSSDSRAQSVVDQWIVEGIDRATRPKTMQALWAGQPNALWAWLQEHEPHAAKRTRWVLMCKDYIRYRLTGEIFAEITDMSGTSLLDVGRGEYDSPLLDTFGIPDVAGRLPPLRMSADVCGHVTPAAADATGLLIGTPVAGGLFDIDACALSSALMDEKTLGITLGTWGINQYVTSTPVTEGVFMTSRYCLPDHYLVLEGSATSASNLEWFLNHFLESEVSEARRLGEDVYSRINRLVADTPVDTVGPLFLPFLYGSNVDPAASACLIGLRASHGRGNIVRAVYEGVVFAHKIHWERLQACGASPDQIRASGGAARSDVWMQLVADVLQLPVTVPHGSELGALGAAICASVAAGCYPDYQTACSSMVRFSRHFEPRADLNQIYQDKFERTRKFLQTMEGVWTHAAPPG